MLYLYICTGKAVDFAATRSLAQQGAVWVSPPALQRTGGNAIARRVRPGDALVLLWKQHWNAGTARLVGAGRIASPHRPWSNSAWLDTIGKNDPLFAAAVAVGYGGPRGYRTMARLQDWVETARGVRALAPGVDWPASGGRVAGVPRDAVISPLDAEAIRPLTYAREELTERIVVRPGVYGGKPVIRGLRIAVEHVLEWLAAGADSEEILREYPALEEADIRACLHYAGGLVAGERVETWNGPVDASAD